MNFRSMFSIFSLLLMLSTQAESYQQSEASKKYDAQAASDRVRPRSFSRSQSRFTKFKPQRSYASESRRDKIRDPEFRSNLRKYKSYSPERKQRYKENLRNLKSNYKWDNMSESQKSKLKRRVIEKHRKKRRSRRR